MKITINLKLSKKATTALYDAEVRHIHIIREVRASLLGLAQKYQLNPDDVLVLVGTEDTKKGRLKVDIEIEYAGQVLASDDEVSDILLEALSDLAEDFEINPAEVGVKIAFDHGEQGSVKSWAIGEWGEREQPFGAGPGGIAGDLHAAYGGPAEDVRVKQQAYDDGPDFDHVEAEPVYEPGQVALVYVEKQWRLLRYAPAAGPNPWVMDSTYASEDKETGTYYIQSNWLLDDDRLEHILMLPREGVGFIGAASLGEKSDTEASDTAITYTEFNLRREAAECALRTPGVNSPLNAVEIAGRWLDFLFKADR